MVWKNSRWKSMNQVEKNDVEKKESYGWITCENQSIADELHVKNHWIVWGKNDMKKQRIIW